MEEKWPRILTEIYTKCRPTPGHFFRLFRGTSRFYGFIMSIGAELAGAAGARAPPLFDPRPEIL